MKEIFVFGSNLAGRHGRGSAKAAHLAWGAEYGVGIGRTGDAYAIPTKDSNLQVLTQARIEVYVNEFIQYAKDHPELTFNIVKIGTGLAGHDNVDMAINFMDAPDNCILHEDWREIIILHKQGK